VSKRGSLWPVIFAMVVIVTAPIDPLFAAGNIATLLQKADDLKLPKHVEFETLVDEITARKGEMTARERHWLEYLQGWDLAYDGKYVDAISHLQTMLSQNGDLTLSFRGRATLINVLVLAKQHERAFIELGKLTDQAPSITDRNALRQGLSIAALLLNDVGDYELGLAYAEQLIAQDKRGLGPCSGMQLKLSALYRSGRLTATSPMLQEGLAVCIDAGELLHTNTIRAYLIGLLINEGRHDQALAQLKKHYDEVIGAKYPRLIAEYDMLLARSYRMTGDSTRAKQYARLALDHGVKGEFTRPLIEAYRLLYEIAKEQGELSAALGYYEQYTTADKGLQSDVTVRDVTYQRVKHQVDFTKLQIDSLNKENEVLQLEQKLSDKVVENIRLYVVLLIVVLGFIGLWAYRTKRSQLHFIKLSRRDGLTGAANRSHFMEIAERTLRDCQAEGQQV